LSGPGVSWFTAKPRESGANPERIEKSQVRSPIDVIGCLFDENATGHAKTRIDMALQDWNRPLYADSGSFSAQKSSPGEIVDLEAANQRINTGPMVPIGVRFQFSRVRIVLCSDQSLRKPPPGLVVWKTLYPLSHRSLKCDQRDEVFF
jgi:hypothetical protein